MAEANDTKHEEAMAAVRALAEGTTKRFDGYNYFGEHPEQMIEWFDSHMK